MTQSDGNLVKKKKSRWGSKAAIPGLTTKVPSMTSEQDKIFLCQVKIEQARSLLRKPDLGIPANPDDRSPSPDPIYNSAGQRTNTRDARTKKKLENKLQQAIQELQTLCPSYVPPVDCRQATKYTHKVFIPLDKNPHINFVGMLIGPRGSTLKEMEEESGCKIIIRGKGSVKEGKLSGAEMLPGADEPLHAYLTANHMDSIQKATALINKIVNEAINNPEGESVIRQKQMMQLAVLNGTVTKNMDMLSKVKEKSDSRKIFTNCLVCNICGSGGHLSADCKFKGDTSSLQNQKMDQMQMNTEYMSLMKELNNNNNNNDGTNGQELPSVKDQATNNIAFCNWQDLFTAPAVGSFVDMSGTAGGALPTLGYINPAPMPVSMPPAAMLDPMTGMNLYPNYNTHNNNINNNSQPPQSN